MNFGTLKDIFVEKLVESYSSEDKTGKDLYKNFLKTLKESETLKTAFIVFKNLETKTLNSETSANEYLKESVSLFDDFVGGRSLDNEIDKLVTLLENNEVEYKDKETKTLHKDLQSLITSKKNIHTLNKLQEAKDGVVSWLVSEKNDHTKNDLSEENYVRENINLNKFLEIATNKFNEKYKDSLSEEEKNILKVLRENNEENTKSLVEKLIKETVTLINNHLKDNNNITIKEKLLETKDTVYNMCEENDNFSSKVLKLYELKRDLAN